MTELINKSLQGVYSILEEIKLEASGFTEQLNEASEAIKNVENTLDSLNIKTKIEWIIPGDKLKNKSTSYYLLSYSKILTSTGKEKNNLYRIHLIKKNGDIVESHKRLIELPALERLEYVKYLEPFLQFFKAELKRINYHPED